MKKPSLPPLSHTLHQIMVGVIATVLGTLIAMWILSSGDRQAIPDNEPPSIEAGQEAAPG